jgi:3-oxoacyl-[acyl-carrier protein] reductase
MPLLKNKVVIVTGAGRGIGSHITPLLASEGANVVIHYNKSAQSAEQLGGSLKGRHITVQADLSTPSGAHTLIARTIEEFGRLDVLVNNASSFASNVLIEDDEWQSYLDEFNGVFGVTFHTCKAAAPIMKSQGGGRIINFAANLTARPTSGFGAHTAAKSALISFSRVLSQELARYNITVNTVSPGMTTTEDTLGRSEAVRNSVASQTPLGRLAAPQDVARIVLFLASDLSGFVTGACITPDGGLTSEWRP